MPSKKGKKGKGKKGGYRKAARRVRSSLGRLIKAIVVITPAAATGYEYSKGGSTTGQKILYGLLGFQMCYTGLRGGGADLKFDASKLVIGWGPPLIIGGINYGLKAVHQQGANPFRVMSQLG